jgi:hypothetical protein
MPNDFHRRPDGLIRVQRDDGTVYVDTNANFVTDFGQALPAMQMGASEQIYSQGIRHCYAVGNNVVGGGPMPYSYGDAAIAALDTLLSNQAARPKPIPPGPSL